MSEGRDFGVSSIRCSGCGIECMMFGAFVTALISTVEPLKHQLHIEMTQKLTSTDHLLKENITKLVHSKVIV